MDRGDSRSERWVSKWCEDCYLFFFLFEACGGMMEV